MLIPRIIPCLLLQDGSLVKTVRFEKPSYIGDPINAVRIYNKKEVDELIFLDIEATRRQAMPPLKLLSEIATECFMPIAYGGGVRSLSAMESIYRLGIEKIALNSYVVENPAFVTEAAKVFGSQSIIASIDVRKNKRGLYEVYTQGGRRSTGIDPIEWAIKVEELGAGEILLTSIERDGTQQGYDIALTRRVTKAVTIPVIACGGAGTIHDLGKAIKEGGASACATGSMVVYFGRNRAVLISFPSRSELETELS